MSNCNHSQTSQTSQEGSDEGGLRLPPQLVLAGNAHPSLQQSDSPVKDVVSLRAYLDSGTDPLFNWMNVDNDTVDMHDMTTWFPRDDRIALYVPCTTKDTPEQAPLPRYEMVSYKQLHDQLQACPPFSPRSKEEDVELVSDAPVVAIVIPGEQMAETAVVLLSVLAHNAVAVPLDPRMPTLRILEALDQLGCTHVVSTEELLMDLSLLNKQHEQFITDGNVDGNDTELQRLFDSFLERTQEIRIVEPDCRGGGRVKWTTLEKREMIPFKNGVVTWMEGHVVAPPGGVRAVQDEHQPAMLLRTSGTTSTPKVVPISKSMLLYGCLCIASTLKLKRDDCCANAMPFYHIGGVSCNLLAVLVSGSSVILAGPLKDPNAFLDHLLLPEGRSYNDDSGPQLVENNVSATWYYAGPSMHKAILLMAKTRAQLPNNIRFIRSASAHLSYDLAMELSSVFQTQVIPTYGMTEAMPICSSTPLDARTMDSVLVNSVGQTVGTSVCILHPELGHVLEYGEGEDAVGEIAVYGAGVIPSYRGLDVRNTHTPDGWLRTGDMGRLDRNGRLFIVGRSKEMIKRGGEQIWPNQIDDVVEKVPGVATAVAFGVPNELWGEEVAVAVVLDTNNGDLDDEKFQVSMREKILSICRDKLDAASMPKQIKFVPSVDSLPRGPTGKYIRSNMSSHLQITPVDTGALRALQSVKSEAPFGTQRVIPSEALNGIRFLVACFVVHIHVGLFPNLPWVKLQTYFPNMTIFFVLCAFQLTCSVAKPVNKQWANFVGTKIGSLHALFVVTQLFALPAYILFLCADEEGDLYCDAYQWTKLMTMFFFSTTTGLLHGQDVNYVTWFQSTLYMFLFLFPFFDAYLRRRTTKTMVILLLLFTCIATFLLGILFLTVPNFWDIMYNIAWSLITWAPLLLAAMMAGYLFQKLIRKLHYRSTNSISAAKLHPDSIRAEDIQEYSTIAGYVTDAMSFVLFMACIVTLLSPNCLCVYAETFEQMRPNEDLPEDICDSYLGGDEYVWTCDITHREFVNYIYLDPHHKEYGRFPTWFGAAFGYLRGCTPVILVWIVAMAFGRGLTARLMRSKVMTTLAPLGYPVYLLHMPITRYYWVATRGLKSQPWWYYVGEFPAPVEWYELFIILGLSVFMGYLVDKFVVPPIHPFFISLGVKVCSWLSKCGKRCACCLGLQCDNDADDIRSESNKNSSNLDLVKTMVRGITGVDDVDRSLELRSLGLDSLGSAALLGMLRANVPAARTLTLQELSMCDTVGELVEVLDGRSSSTISTSSSSSSSS